MLGGLLRREQESGGVSTSRFTSGDLDQRRDQLERYEALCRQFEADPSHVAMAWLLSRPGITSVVSGPSSVEQLNGVVGALEVRLDQEMLTQLDEIFPGYKTAPEDYAF